MVGALGFVPLKYAFYFYRRGFGQGYFKTTLLFCDYLVLALKRHSHQTDIAQNAGKNIFANDNFNVGGGIEPFRPAPVGIFVELCHNGNSLAIAGFFDNRNALLG
jgi:hypothetical protein